jgi:ABC-2 type transport system permease protein
MEMAHMKPTNPIQAILAVAWKDIQILFKDTGFLVVVILLPAAFSVLFGTINQRAIENDRAQIMLPVALVNQDAGLYGEQIVKILKDIDALEITDLAAPAEAEQKVRDSEVMAAILIPAMLTDNINAYQPSEIQVLVDPTQKQYASIITGIMKDVVSPVVLVGELSYGIRSILATYPSYQQADAETRRGFEAQSLAVNMAAVQKMQADPWVKVEMKTSQGENLIIVPDNIFAMVVPSFTVMFTFFIVGAMAADLLKERQEGSLRRLIASPMPRWTIIAGKMLAYVVVVIAQVTLIFGAASLIFDMPLGKNILALALVTIAMGLAATGLGMLVAAISKTDRQADTTGTLLGFILAGLGGCFSFGVVPIYKGGGIMETISKFIPHSHALLSYDALMIRGQGMAAVLPEIGILLGFALLFLLVATWRFRFE